MEQSEDRLQKYIHKMLQLQDKQREKPLSEAELKEIAFELGMSEEDWQASKEAYRNYLKSGQGHINYGNWSEAIKELEQASALNPNSLEASYGLATAYKEQWLEDPDEKFKVLAQKYAQRALDLEAGHKPSLKVLSELRSQEKANRYNKSTRLIVLGAVFGLVVLVLGIIYTLNYNMVVAKAEEVNKKWAQVENVYQRRSDLIPRLIQSVQAANDYEQKIIQELQEAEANLAAVDLDSRALPPSQLADFQAKQSQLGEALNQFFQISRKNPDLESSQAFRDLQVQIEGSENRISVERKRYNDQVADFNAYIKRFPASLLGFEEKPYFKVDKKALKSPEIKFE